MLHRPDFTWRNFAQEKTKFARKGNGLSKTIILFCTIYTSTQLFRIRVNALEICELQIFKAGINIKPLIENEVALFIIQSAEFDLSSSMVKLSRFKQWPIEYNRCVRSI